MSSMKYFAITLISALLILSTDMDSHASDPVSIIPAPRQLELHGGYFHIDETTVIQTRTSHADAFHIAEYLGELLRSATTWDHPVVGESDGKRIELRLVEHLRTDRLPDSRSTGAFSFFDQAPVYDASVHPVMLRANQGASPEAYSLLVTRDRVVISATDPRGLFFGVQTLRQLLPAEVEHTDYSRVPRDVIWRIPRLTVYDSPEFAYRGMHLDVGRHFRSVEFVKRYIDLLAKHKMNTFHWHLTEDQGWRIHIEQYPKLTEIGGFRDSTVIGRWDSGRYDGQRYGGYYTQDEIRAVVEHARKRYITIIPEIEMPGHASAALAAYPEFGCEGHTYHVQTTWGIFPEIFCPSEETFAFLKDVLDEVIGLFPGPYIHIGGDEAMKDHWRESELAQAVIRREGLADEDELQSYFVSRINDHIRQRGRILVGWDEILDGGLAEGATVMSWRGERGGITAARMGHDAIMSPTSHCYLDYYQAQPESEPLAIGGFLPIEKVYSYHPIPDGLEREHHHHILGVQGNVWTEYMRTARKVEYMAFPRALAIAEVGWTSPSRRDFGDFSNRLGRHLERFDILDVLYFRGDIKP